MEKQMKIYLLNATLNGKLLSEILCRKLDISGMISLDQSGMNKTPEYYDYRVFCERENIDFIELESYSFQSDHDKKILEKLEIDLLIVASWQRLIPDWLIRRCKIGIIGAHGSHEGIERGRGRSPMNWAIMTDKKSFTFSIFWIEEGTDNGAIIDTRTFEYLPTDTILSSYVMINFCKADMILKNIENGRIPNKEGTPQKKEGLYLPQRKKEDGMIDWNRDAVSISNMVRALTKPYPGAYAVLKGEEYYIWVARPVVIETEHDLYDGFENGTVISILGESVLVKCGKDYLLIDEYTGGSKLCEGMTFETADYKKQMRSIIERHNEKNGTPLSRLVLDEVE